MATRIIDWCGEDAEIDTFQDCHLYGAQKEFAGGFPLNPILRTCFDVTPNDLREDIELVNWWGKPYIKTDTHTIESYAEYKSRVSDYEDFDIQPETQFNAEQIERRKKWLKAWPSGTRYEARCLNGGAWDRSSSLGMCSTLEQAITLCENAPEY